MRIVILGAGGRLGAALLREYKNKFDVVDHFNHAQLDLAKPKEIRDKLSPIQFDLLINCAAFTNVDLAESKREQAFAINAEAPKLLAEICRDRKAKLIHFSTDYVFDGEKREPYLEDDATTPVSIYGKSKRAGERFVLQTSDRHLVVRVSWVFGPDRPSFVDSMIKRAQEHEKVDAIADKFSAPTYTLDIAEMLPRFFNRESAGGVLHFANAGECSWQEYAQWAVDCCEQGGLPLKTKKIVGSKLKDMSNWVARRPVYSVLCTQKYEQLAGTSPRTWRDAVADYITRFYSKK